MQQTVRPPASRVQGTRGRRWRYFWELVRDAASNWSAHGSSRKGAALSYYTLFSIAPLLIVVLAVAGIFVDNNVARQELFRQLATLIGPAGAETVNGILRAANDKGTGVVSAIVAAATTLLGATTVFAELKDGLDEVWDTKRKKSSGIWQMIRTRLLSFGVVMALGFLLLVSLVVSTVMTAVSAYVADYMPGLAVVGLVLNNAAALLVIAAIFAAIYKLLPDVRLTWRDVAVGALTTAVLFTVGKILIGLYLGTSAVTNAFGAAGSLVLIIVWVYFSAQIFLFGAELTRLFTERHGSQQ